jgi:hypothetical protein
MLGTMWGGPSRPAKEQAEPPAGTGDSALNPFAPWAAMMSGALGGPAAPELPVPPEPKAPQPQDPFEFFHQMMATGLEVQQQYLAALQNIFDSYWGAGADRR